MVFRCGQLVRWPHAPRGFAQVVELRRTCVRVYYLAGTGRAMQPIVRAAELEEIQKKAHQDLPLPLHNFFGRAWMRGSKRFAPRNRIPRDTKGFAR